MDLEWYLEAEKRGLLNPDDQEWLAEARRRGLAPGGTPSASSASPAPKEDVSTLGDVAKSAGIGVAQGAIGLGTLPGNIEKLGRMGINGVGSLFGAEGPVVNPDTALINYDDLKGAIESRTGEFYKPKTVAGEYSRTLGEMLPNLIGGAATVGGKVASVVGPAIFSETAGQLTKGSDKEGLARVGGAIAGGIAGPRMVSRAVTPVRSSPEAMQAADALEAAGVQGLTAGQRTGNRALRVAEQVTDYVPFSGRRNQQMADQANQTFTQAAMRAAGLNEPGVLDRQNLGRMFQEIGREYDNLRVRAPVQADPSFLRRLDRIETRYYRNTAPMAAVPGVRDVVNEIRTRAATPGAGLGGGILTAGEYQAWRSQLSKAAASATDPTTSRALRDLTNTLDNQMIRSLPQAERAGARDYFRDLNRRYRGLKKLEDAVGGQAGGDAARGLISSASLKKSAKKGDISEYTRGRTPMARLANEGERVMEKLPDSGTAQRSAIMKMMSGENATKIGAGLAVGGSGMGMVDALTGGATLATGAGLSRLLMSPLMQRYLSNRVYPQGMPAIPRGRLGNEWEALTGLPPIPREVRMMSLPQTAVSNSAPLSGSQQGMTADQLEEEERGAFRR